MKKNAFTLIELLAVIVILAIIALIAVPIVINIINDSKVSSDEQTVELYLDTVEKAITKKQLSNPNLNPDKCVIQNNGNIECFKEEKSLGIIKIEMKGKMPEKGKIELKNNKHIYKNILLNGKYYYEIGKLVNDADNNGEISIGDKYTYKVNDTDTFNFYVLSLNNDDTVNLIMDRNICESGKPATKENKCLTKWYDDGDDDPNNDINSEGPIYAMNVLYNATKNWINVPNINLDYDDYLDRGGLSWHGYKGINIVNGIGVIINKLETQLIPIGTKDEPLKARLPKFSEITSEEAGCSTIYQVESCNSWLMENLDDYGLEKYASISKISGIQGYWLLASLDVYAIGAIVIERRGTINFTATSYDDKYGIRPVITVSKDDLIN